MVSRVENEKEKRENQKGRDWLYLSARGSDVREEEGRVLRLQEHQRNPNLSNVCLLGKNSSNLIPSSPIYYFSFLMRRQLLKREILLQ